MITGYRSSEQQANKAKVKRVMETVGFYARPFMILSFLTFLTACPNPNGSATIRFEQLGACNGYKDGVNVISAGPNAAFVLFKINNIDNRNGTVNFSYDPAKLCISSSSPAACVSSNLSLVLKIGKLGTTSTTVSAGTDLPQNGYAVIAVPTSASPDPQVEANKVNYFLTYATGSGDPGVLLDKKNSSQTQYQGAQDCLSKSW
ncbi:MAG: hypothetical protein WBD16_03905 [Pyrinomonadaceae bacterium]